MEDGYMYLAGKYHEEN